VGHDKVMIEKGFDRHTASTYLIALKGLGMLNDIKCIKFTAYRKLLTRRLVEEIRRIRRQNI